MNPAPYSVGLTGQFKFIGGPLDGKTIEVDLGDIVYRDGPFEWRLAVQPCKGDFPFQYVFVEKRQMEAAQSMEIPE